MSCPSPECYIPVFFFFIKEPSFCLTFRHVLGDTSQMNKAYVWLVIRSPRFMIGCTWPSWLYYPSFFTGFSLIIPTEIKQQSEFSLFFIHTSLTDEKKIVFMKDKYMLHSYIALKFTINEYISISSRFPLWCFFQSTFKYTF